MANLPEELITEILLKLPIKSLLKFRSVCKSWLELISSPEFVKNHLLLSTTNKDYNHHGILLKFASKNEHGVKDCSLRDVLYHPETGALVDLDYPGKNRHDHPFLVGSVNGLVCLAFGLYDLFIWNPSIRKHMKLRNYELNLIMIYSWESESPGNFKSGFGYDELQDDYKEYGVKESWTKMLAIKKSPVGFRSHVRGPPILMSNEGEFLL
ncbi:hypothetical protein BC332_06866 [Capsicum chinense]|nr:hypothetical protein BC332_06866 [Capsicum chinense]